MGKKKSIPCDCGAECIAVGKVLGYPKRCHNERIIAKGKPTERRIGGHEYRYTCSKCDKEWLHDTFLGVVFPIESAQFHIKIRNGKEVYTTRDHYIIKHYGLKSGKAAEGLIMSQYDLGKLQFALASNSDKDELQELINFFAEALERHRKIENGVKGEVIPLNDKE